MTFEPGDFQSRLRTLLGLQGAVLTDQELSQMAESYPRCRSGERAPRAPVRGPGWGGGSLGVKAGLRLSPVAWGGRDVGVVRMVPCGAVFVFRRGDPPEEPPARGWCHWRTPPLPRRCATRLI